MTTEVKPYKRRPRGTGGKALLAKELKVALQAEVARTAKLADQVKALQEKLQERLPLQRKSKCSGCAIESEPAYCAFCWEDT